MLTVLMATYNGAGTLPQVLRAYMALRPPVGGWRLVIADNGSTDATARVIAAFRGRLPLSYLYVARRGRSPALNGAVEHALRSNGDGSELFVFGDDDAMPASDWLCRLQGSAREHPGYALFGGAITSIRSTTSRPRVDAGNRKADSPFAPGASPVRAKIT